MTLDKAGRITAIDDPLHTPNWTFGYGANGELLTTGCPTTTALTTTSAYDALGRLTARTTTPGSRASHTQTYNRAGQRLTEQSTITGDPASGTATTGYDPLGRLTSFSLPSLARTLGAAWDAVPNRTSLTTDGVPASATFDAANRPTSGGYGADPDGRITSRPGQTLAYDSLGRLTEVRTAPGNTLVARYGYDPLDRLLTVERPGQVTIRFRYAGTTTAAAQVVEDGVGVLRSVTVGPEGTPLQDWATGDQRLYGTNGHHDTVFTTDAARTISATLRSDPWGNLAASTGASLPDWRFQGSWFDTSTGLAWSVARWYDPQQGTFTSEDTLLGDPESPPSRHLYAYAEGDPVGGWDPGGTWPWDWVKEQVEKALEDNHANAREKRRCRSDLPQCLVWGRVSQFATAEARERYPISIKTNGMGDAYRHCLWQCGLAFRLGRASARTWGDIHEARGPVGQHETMARSMDQHNNEIGRRLAHDVSPNIYGPSWHTQAKALCRRALSNGSLWIIDGWELIRSNGRPLSNSRRGGQ